ncbi:hypothetical protein N7G274_008738 [Stereocaulon virgatum]|uniref:Uncharacterized protein n=1 Tax=Stereocaulon virgatum TaxID=373712 RepID=A0ABR3ZXJ2_9LECA
MTFGNPKVIFMADRPYVGKEVPAGALVNVFVAVEILLLEATVHQEHWQRFEKYLRSSPEEMQIRLYGNDDAAA